MCEFLWKYGIEKKDRFKEMIKTIVEWTNYAEQTSSDYNYYFNKYQESKLDDDEAKKPDYDYYINKYN